MKFCDDEGPNGLQVLFVLFCPFCAMLFPLDDLLFNAALSLYLTATWTTAAFCNIDCGDFA